MTLLIVRDFGPTLHLEPHAEGLRRPAWLVDEAGLVFLRCACGVVLGSLRNHVIAEDGTVTPSVLHDTNDDRWRQLPQCAQCDWHTWVRLEHWVYGRMNHGVEKIVPVRPVPGDKEK